jgi:hypothetical protein
LASLRTAQQELNAALELVKADILAHACKSVNIGCFTAGTLLWTPEGYRPIEEIQVGDRVYSRDEYDPAAPAEAKVVEEVFRNFAGVYNLHVGGQIIGTTAEHPFYVVEKGWTNAFELRPGDRVLCADGSSVAVDAVVDTGEWLPVFNLRIADHHTYFVGDVGWGFSVWSHNTCFQGADPNLASTGEAYRDRAVQLRNTIPLFQGRGGTTVAVSSVGGQEVVVLYANIGNSGDLLRNQAALDFQARVTTAGGRFYRVADSDHAESSLHTLYPNVNVIGISNTGGPCSICTNYFTTVKFFNIWWPD